MADKPLHALCVVYCAAEGVHDGHGLGGDTGVRVNLFQHLVDVDGVRLPPPRQVSVFQNVKDLVLAPKYQSLGAVSI